MEVIARRKEILGALWFLFIVLGAGFAVFGVFAVTWTAKADEVWYLLLSVFVLAGGAFICGLGLFEFIRFCRTPKVIISQKNGVLTFPYFTCRADEVSQVTYKFLKRNNIFGVPTDLKSGKLQVVIGERLFIAHNVAEVEKVHNRLLSLKQQYQGK